MISIRVFSAIYVVKKRFKGKHKRMKRIFTLLTAILIIGLFSCKKNDACYTLKGKWVLDKAYYNVNAQGTVSEGIYTVPATDKHEFNFTANNKVTILFRYPERQDTSDYRFISANEIEFSNFYSGGPLYFEFLNLNEFTLTLPGRCGYEINYYKRAN